MQEQVQHGHVPLMKIPKVKIRQFESWKYCMAKILMVWHNNESISPVKSSIACFCELQMAFQACQSCLFGWEVSSWFVYSSFVYRRFVYSNFVYWCFVYSIFQVKNNNLNMTDKQLLLEYRIMT